MHTRGFPALSPALAAILVVAGCSQGNGGPGTTDNTGAGGAFTTTSSRGGAGGALETGGAASGGAASGGADAGTEVTIPDQDFEGIDTTIVPMGTPPTGCVGGFDAETGTLSLTLDGAVNVMLLGAIHEHITVNGVICTAADETKATTTNTVSIQISGAGEDDTVIIDLAAGELGLKTVTPPGGVLVDLGSGNDTFELRGSYGKDKVTASTVNGASALDLDADGKANIVVGGAPALTVSLGPGNDDLRGSGFGGGQPLALPVTVHAGAGNDMLQGGAAGDLLHGDAGDDTFLTAPTADGADLYDGGDGYDTVDYSERAASLHVSLNDGGDDGEYGEHDNVISNVEVLFGGSGNDMLTGGSRDVTIYGGPGNDTVRGGPGNDALYGEAGHDYVVGDAGDDILYGDAGDDWLDGGAGDDLLDGGSGHNKLDAGMGDGDICIGGPADLILTCELC